ncbi:GLABROUS1 enhancer-binding protein family [Dillenia turbinata]|uniref:GLABROUS1 enhancer-binding protein family n=1 Tax=Dillenia turbinata TaxID=194707 RepID=A0AAN8UWN5_9MAGN
MRRKKDEIGLLEGYCHFVELGKNPTANLSEFCEFVKQFVSFVVSIDQVKNKLRHLKDKFFNPSKRQRMNKIVFELSEHIWGHLVKVDKEKSSESVSEKRNEIFERQMALGDTDQLNPVFLSPDVDDYLEQPLHAGFDDNGLPYDYIKHFVIGIVEKLEPR